MTDGGDGTSGRKFSEESIEKLRKASTGKTASDTTRKKMSIGRKGINSGNKCVLNRPEIRKLSNDSKRGVKQSDEHIAKRTKHMHGDNNPSKKYRLNCVHCGKECCLGTLSRWHNDNCKYR